MPLRQAMFFETNPVPVKTAMAALGLCDETFRLPLCELSTDENREKLMGVLKDLSIL